MRWAFNGILAALCLLFTPIPVSAADEIGFAELELEELPPEDAKSWESGMGYIECRTGSVMNCSVSENGMTAVAAGEYVLVYDADGKFLCSFYEETSHSHLIARMHDDWIELIECSASEDRYAAYKLDGTPICFATLPETRSNQDILNDIEYKRELHESRGVYMNMTLGVTKKMEDGRTVSLYSRDNAVYVPVYPARTSRGEPFQFPESTALQEQYPDLPVDLGANMRYAIQSFSVDGAGHCLIRAGNDLLLFTENGQYIRTLRAQDVCTPHTLLHLDADHVQLYQPDDRVLLTYSRMGKFLYAEQISDTPANEAAMEDFSGAADPETWQEMQFQKKRDSLTLIQPDGRRLFLYIRQSQEEERNFGMIYGIFIALALLTVFLIRWKDARDSKTETAV